MVKVVYRRFAVPRGHARVRTMATETQSRLNGASSAGTAHVNGMSVKSGVVPAGPTPSGGVLCPVSSFKPSLTCVFNGACQYELQDEVGHAALLDLCACMTLCRCGDGAAAFTDAFRVMDADNGRHDGKLSLSECKRLICAVLTVIREVRRLSTPRVCVCGLSQPCVCVVCCPRYTTA